MPKARRGLAPVLALLLMFGLAPGLAAQIEGEQWTSPTYGFSVSWAGTAWQPDPESELVAVGPERLDRLQLVNGSSSLYFEGATRYKGNLSSCIAAEANLLTQETGVTGIRPYRDDDGAPLAADGPDASAAAFTLTLAVGDQKVELIDYVECRSLISGEAVLIVTLVTEPAVFRDELASARRVIDTISLSEAPAQDPLAAYGGWLAAAQAAPSVAGPLSGELSFGPRALGLERAGVDLADFYARAEFTNPEPSREPWDIGVGFRDKDDDAQYRLVVDSTGAWFFKDGLGPVIASGSVVDFDTSPSGSNIIDIVAAGDTGYFAFNERLVDILDLSGRTESGDVFVGAGFFAEDAAMAGSSGYSQFEIWSLADIDSASILAPVAEMDQTTFDALSVEAVAAAPVAGPVAGELVESVGSASIAPAGVDLEQFVAQATFVNPSDAAERPWDFGFAFREQPGGNHYRLTVSSDGSWEFQIGLQAPLTGGRVPSLSFEAGATNTLELAVGSDAAAFSVNGAYVSDLDVSDLDGPSDVWIGTGFHRANAEQSRVTRFRDFSVWTLPTASAPVPAAPAGTPVADGSAAASTEPVALRLADRGEFGVEAFAVLTPAADETTVTVTAIDTTGDEVLVIQEGTCAEEGTLPAFLLEHFDGAGRSETTIAAPLTNLIDGAHSLAIHRTADEYGTIVACADIRGGEEG